MICEKVYEGMIAAGVGPAAFIICTGVPHLNSAQTAG